MLFDAGRDLGLPLLQLAPFSVVLVLRNSPARFYAVTGRIDGDGFKFDLGQSTFSFVAMSNGFIYGKVVNAGRTSRISLEHVE